MGGKFTETWASQTEIGKRFGLNPVEMGIKLTQLGLREPDTRHPTLKALSEGYCRPTPLRDGTPFYMWHKGKVAHLIQTTPQIPSDAQAGIKQWADQWIDLQAQINEADTQKALWLKEKAKKFERKAIREGLADQIIEELLERNFEGEIPDDGRPMEKLSHDFIGRQR